MLEMNLLRAPAVCDLIEHNLYDFCASLVNPRDAAVVESDVSLGYGWHVRIFYRSSSLDSIWFYRTSARQADRSGE